MVKPDFQFRIDLEVISFNSIPSLLLHSEPECDTYLSKKNVPKCDFKKVIKVSAKKAKLIRRVLGAGGGVA